MCTYVCIYVCVCMCVCVYHSRLSDHFFLNNQLDALIIQIYCHKTLHVSGIFSAHHQEFSTAHSALVVSCRFLMTASKQSQDGTSDSAWKRSSQTCMKLTSAECTVENS
jgi:hypothetical protein